MTKVVFPNLKKLCSLFDVPDLGEITQAKLDFSGIGHRLGPNSVNQTPDRLDTIFLTAVKTEVPDEL